jgi:hypothetical protein
MAFKGPNLGNNEIHGTKVVQWALLSYLALAGYDK